MAAVKRKVMVILVPLVGLGSDQVAKSVVSDHNVEAYHVDEHKGQDAYDLRDCLLRLRMDDKEMDNISIILYISPSSFMSYHWPRYGWVGQIEKH